MGFHCLFDSQVRKFYLKDVKVEFSPVYWIENGTVVPTTTTTSTTSTTTHATTTSTGNPAPIHEPPVVQIKDMGVTHSGPDSLENSMLDSPTNNEIPQDKPENLAEKHQKPAMAGIGLPSSSTGASALMQWSACLAALLTLLPSLII